jgi:hypothetical protein
MTKIEIIELPIQSKLKFEDFHCSSVLGGRLAACVDCELLQVSRQRNIDLFSNILSFNKIECTKHKRGIGYECSSGSWTGPEECILNERQSRCRYKS